MKWKIPQMGLKKLYGTGIDGRRVAAKVCAHGFESE